MFKLINRTSTLLAILALSATSGSYAATVSDTLDSLTANATFTYTGGDGKKLDQIGRHAFSFGRIRFSTPSQTVNLVNLTPPSISPPNCSSININLGSFDIISLDEALSILRRIASEALTYGFGLALQSMCSPCWSSMKTLQNQLERLNLANRNTCTMVRSFIDEKTDNGALFNIHDKLCKGEASLLGDDEYMCGLVDSSTAESVADGYDSFISFITASGGDPDASFVYGNVIADVFSKMQTNVTLPDTAFPSEISMLILGTPTVDPTNSPTHAGISPTEAAMNMFGYFQVGSNSSEEKAKSGWQESQVENITSLIESKIEECDGPTCRMLYQCNDVSVTGSSGNTTTFACGSHTLTRPSYAAVIAEYDAIPDELCSDKADEPTLPEILRCQVQSGYKRLTDGAYTDLTPLQQKTIQATPAPIIRALAIGTEQDEATVLKLMSDNLSQYLTYNLLYTYVKDLAQVTSTLLQKAEDEMSLDKSYVAEIREEIQNKLDQADDLRSTADEYLATLTEKAEYGQIIDKYGSSLSSQVSSQAAKGK